jgi:hypothetical protein
VFLLLLLFARNASAQDGVIEGVVRDSIIRAGVPGVTIEATGPDTSRSTVSDAKGEFRFDHLTPATYRLKYTLTGYLGSDAKGTAVIALPKGGATERIALEVTPFARLEGVVLGEEGRPLEGVNVYTDANLQATTDAEGHYAIERLQPGRYQIMLRAPLEIRRATAKRNPETGEVFGYANVEFYPGVADRQAATPVTVSGGLDLRGFDIRLRRVRLVEFSGRIVERVGGEALPPGARVELSGTNTTIPLGVDGGFRFELLPPSNYSLLVYRANGSKALAYVVPVEIPKSGLVDYKIAVPPFASVQGSILAPADTEWAGQVILGLRSSTSPGISREWTVNSEKFTIDDLPPGKWVLEVESNALKKPDAVKLFIQSARLGTQNALAEPLTITESGNPPLEIRLTRESGRIAGTVVDENGIPRKNTVVLVSRSGSAAFRSSGSTREDGTVTIDGLAPGTYRLLVLERGSTAMRTPTVVEVKTGETTIVRLTAPNP